jgi:hypothetical protein
MSGSPELQFPKVFEEAAKFHSRADAITMKGNVTSFISENKAAHLLQWSIITVPLEKTVISGTDDLRQCQNLEFKAYSEKSATGTKYREAPMPSAQPTSKTSYRTAEQPGMFPFLVKPKVNHLLHFRRLCPKELCVPSDQTGWAATVAQLENFQRRKEFRNLLWSQGDVLLPLGFNSVASVIAEMIEPLGLIQCLVEV